MILFKLNLKAFDESGAAPTSSGEASGVSSSLDAVGNGASSSEGNIKSDATAGTEPITFEQYMKDHKDEATKWFNERFDKRHADYNKLKENAKSSKGIMEMLATKFGIESSDDITAITEALENDDYLYAQRAEENNRTVDEQREWDKMERENRLYREQQAQAERMQKAQRQYDAWTEQANNLKQVFPSFDLDAELANPDFVQALRSGMSIDRAYYAMHGEEIATGAMQYTAQAVRKATVEDMAASKGRPRENGLSSRAAVKVEKDIGSLTRDERAKLARRSLHERIRF